jgi:hypothetical protein
MLDQIGSYGVRLGGCGLDSADSGQGPLAGSSEGGDEPSGSCATEVVNTQLNCLLDHNCCQLLKKKCIHNCSSSQQITC